MDYFDNYRSWIRSNLAAMYLLGIVGFGLSFRNWKHGALLAIALLPPTWVLAYHTQLFASRYLYFAIPILAVYVGFVAEVAIEQTYPVVRTVASRGAGVGRLEQMAVRPQGVIVFQTLLPIVAILLVVSPSLTFIPHAEYSLGPNAPQPDFQGAYEYVDARGNPDDILVAGWTAPAAYYHGSLDYWLVHSLSGADQQWTTAEGYEVYSGAAPISNATELRSVINCSLRGWVVIDQIAYQRMDPARASVVADLTVHDVEADGMRVYSWEDTGQCQEGGADVGSLSPAAAGKEPRAHG